MEYKKYILLLCVVAVLFGFFAKIGHSIAEYIWPTPPLQLEVVKVDEPPNNLR